MGKSDNNISQPPESKPRPSLFNAGQAATDHNILDAMAGVRSTPQKARRNHLIWLLVPLLAAAGWGISTQMQPAPSPEPVVQTIAKAPPASTVAAVTEPPLRASETNAEPASPFGKLETAGATAPQSGTPAAAHMPAAEGQSTIDAPTLLPALPPSTQAQKLDTPKAASSTKAVAVKVAPSQKSANTKATSNALPKTAKAAAPTNKASGESDPDVELLSAIMKHLGDERGAKAGTARPTQTIAELVKTCNGKDAIETLLCQRRICEGSWGKAQACPQSLAPKRATDAATAQANN